MEVLNVGCKIMPWTPPDRQVMDKDGGYDPNRIPASVFASKPANTSMISSLSSSDSVFSIQFGNKSIDLDNPKDSPKLDELSSPEVPRIRGEKDLSSELTEPEPDPEPTSLEMDAHTERSADNERTPTSSEASDVAVLNRFVINHEKKGAEQPKTPTKQHIVESETSAESFPLTKGRKKKKKKKKKKKLCCCISCDCSLCNLLGSYLPSCNCKKIFCSWKLSNSCSWRLSSCSGDLSSCCSGKWLASLCKCRCCSCKFLKCQGCDCNSCPCCCKWPSCHNCCDCKCSSCSGCFQCSSCVGCCKCSSCQSCFSCKCSSCLGCCRWPTRKNWCCCKCCS